MNKRQRVMSVLQGLVMIFLSAFLAFAIEPEESLLLAGVMVSFSLTVIGIRSMIFYLSMARHMVGGKAMLYFAVIVIDFGIFSATLFTRSVFMVLYLAATHAFAAAISIMRGMEAKQMESKSWIWDMSPGIVNAIIALLCVIFLHSEAVISDIYCLGLCYNAIVRIASAFRKTEIVFIQ